MNRVEAIIFHEQAADELDAKSDEHRWEAARLIAEDLDSGKRQFQLASEIGKSQPHVSKSAALWRKYSHENNRPSWSNAYDEVSSRRPQSEPSPPPPSREIEPYEPDDEVVNGEIVEDNEPSLPNLHYDDKPDAEKAWDDLRRANALLLSHLNRLKRGTRLDGIAAQNTKDTFVSLSDEIQEMWE